MSQTRIEVSRQLLNNLSRLPDRFKRSVKGAMIKTALTHAESIAKVHCRVDTGRLRASIHTEYTSDYGRSARGEIRYRAKAWNRSLRGQITNARDRNRIAEYTSKIRTRIGPMDVIVGTDVHYAKKIERMDGFMVNAYESTKEPMRRAIREAIRRVMQGGR